MISKELMEILVCPIDKGELKEESASNSLECTVCGRLYPVKDGIPVMLTDISVPVDNPEPVLVSGERKN